MPTEQLFAKAPLLAFGACILCGLLSVALGQTPTTGPSEVDRLPSIPELPDPFLFGDGSRVKTPADWDRRRAELREIIQTYEYGHLPPAPPKGSVTATEAPDYEPPPADGSNARVRSGEKDAPHRPPSGATEKRLLLTVGREGKGVSTHVILTIPPGKGPFPVVIRGDLNWGRVPQAAYAELSRRGYLLAEFDRNEIVPDKKGERAGFLYSAYPAQDFGASAAWAWGFHRVIDYLETRDDVDAKRIVVTGHSRGGKAVLLAGVMDDRIALTAPNNSGCGGAGSFRHQAPKSEDLPAILKNFPYWFGPKLPAFVGKIDRLPLDQHFLKAAIAPRALLTTEALGDLWANPEGTQVTYAAAKEVYDFLGAGDKIGIYYREGGHQHNAEDFAVLLDFADKLFAGKDAGRKFDALPFKDAPKLRSWERPGK